jgi:hypothetical protein
LRFAGRFVSSRWLCVRWQSPSLPPRLPQDLIMAQGGTLAPTTPAITRGDMLTDTIGV